MVVWALVPAGVVTDTFTVPATWAGAVTVSFDPDTNVEGSAGSTEPNFTVAPGTNPLPVIVTTVPPPVGPLVGLMPETTGLPKAYRSLLVAALVPSPVVTNTFTAPAACAGAATLNFDEDTNVDRSADPAGPNFTVDPAAKFAPVIVTVFPPAVDPPLGLTPDTTGSPNVYRSLLVAALVSPPLVTNTFTEPAACAGALTVSADEDTNLDRSADPDRPNFTVDPAVKFAPVIVTLFPPAVDPPRGPTAATVGGATTRFALAVLPVPPSSEETAVLSLQLPWVTPVTLTTTSQLELAAINPPLSEIEAVRSSAVTVPPHALLSPFGVATTNPNGSESVNATPDCATVFADGLVIVNVNDVVPFNGTVAAPNAVVIDGGPTTVSVALAVFPVPPLSEETVTLLFLSPAVPALIKRGISQLELAAIDPPVNEIEFDPAIAVRVPPQTLRPVTPGGGMTNPLGSVSVNATPVSAAAFVDGLVIVYVSVL